MSEEVAQELFARGLRCEGCLQGREGLGGREERWKQGPRFTRRLQQVLDGRQIQVGICNLILRKVANAKAGVGGECSG